MSDHNTLYDYNASEESVIFTTTIDDHISGRESDDDYRQSTILPAKLSELTRITIKESHEKVNGPPICLHFIEESNSELFKIDATNFPPPRDPGIDEYINITESDVYFGWERYCRECHKYSLPRISAVKDILDGKTTVFNLRVISNHLLIRRFK